VVSQVHRRFFSHNSRYCYYESEIKMAIVLILPALMLLTLAGVSILALDKPPVEHTLAPVATGAHDVEYELAA
jgi:hypothetical protein